MVLLYGALIKALNIMIYCVLVYLIGRKSIRQPVNKSIILYLLILIAWQFTSLMVSVYSYQERPDLVLQWYQLQTPTIAGYFILFYAVITTFRYDHARMKLCKLGYFIIFAIAIVSLAWGEGFLPAVQIHPTGLYVPEFGPLVPLLGIISVSYLGLAFYDLWRDYRRSTYTRVRTQQEYLLFGVFLVFFGSLLNFIDHLQGFPLEAVFVSFQTIIIFYAVFHHQLLDLRSFIQTGLSYLILGAVVIASLVLSVIVVTMKMFNFTGYVALVTSLLLVIFLMLWFTPLREKLQGGFDRIFSPEQVKLYKLLEEVTTFQETMLPTQSLFSRVQQLGRKYFQINSVYFLIKDIDDNSFVLWHYGSDEEGKNVMTIHEDNPLVRVLKKSRKLILLGEVMVHPMIKGLWAKELEKLENINLEAFFPLRVKDELIGYLCIPARSNSKPFRYSFLRSMQLFASHIAVHIKNALLHEQNVHLSITDSLTGAYNRRMLEKAFAREQQSGNFPMALIMTDICNFKHFNDHYGHQVGDRVLKEVASFLNKCIRSNDLVIRYGGDEFIVFMPGTGNREAQLAAQRIQDRLEDWNRQLGLPGENKILLKLGTCSLEKGSLDDLIYEADQQLLEIQKSLDKQKLYHLYDSSVREKKKISKQMVLALVKSVELRDPYTYGHSERVKDFALQIAKKANLFGPQLEVLADAAILHDIGKIAVPPEVLQKKEPLNEEDISLIQLHPIVGADILAEVQIFEEISNIVRHHHERYDGDCSASPPAYPGDLKGEEIPLLSRVLSLADAFDAMTTSRPYRSCLTLNIVKEILAREAGKQFDRELTIILLSMLENNELWMPGNDSAHIRGI